MDTKPEIAAETEAIIDEVLAEADNQTPGDEKPPEPEKPKETKPEEWVIPGKAKTAEEARKVLRDTERYKTKVEQELKRVKALALGLDPSQAEPEVKESFFADPEKALQNSVESAKAFAAEQAAKVRGEMILEDVQEEYPDFDIEANAPAIKEALSIYSPEHVAKNGRKLLRQIIESKGGKRASSKDNTTAPHIETGSVPDASFAAGTTADKIKDSIVKAEIHPVDIFK